MWAIERKRVALTDRLRFGACLGAWVATIVVPLAAAAQPAPIITDADLERVRREQPVITDQDIARAQAMNPAPAQAPVSSPPPAAPAIDALPQPLTQTPIDLDAIARGYAAQQAAPAMASGPALLVFISLAMPRPSLQRLVEQAARARATLILRGLVRGSLRETAADVAALIGGHEVAVQIDPLAFDRYAVQRVPTFVLAREERTAASCAGNRCAASEAHVRVMGDVSLDYALEAMQRQAPAFAREAAGFLGRLGR